MSKPSLFKNPIAYYRRKWYRHKFNHTKFPAMPVLKTINGVQFIFDCNLSPLVKKMYLNTYQTHVIKAIKKNLKPGDVYFDIGSNIGYTTVIGAGCVGTRGEVHCFEPVPIYFEYLSNVKALNPEYNIVSNNFALGESEETCSIFTTTNQSSIGLNTLLPGIVNANTIADSYTVKVRRLDSYIRENNIPRISLIKIDVEGYELPVLKGTSGYFEEHRNNLPPVVVEVNTPAYALMNTDLKELEDMMLGYGYSAYKINGKDKIDIKNIFEQEDVLFKQLTR